MELECPVCYTYHDGSAGLGDSGESLSTNATCDTCQLRIGTYVCLCAFPLKPVCQNCWKEHCSKHGSHRCLCLYLTRYIRSEADLLKVVSCAMRSDCAIKRIEEVSLPEVSDAIRQVTTLAEEWVARIQGDRDAIVEELRTLERKLREVQHTLLWLPYTQNKVPSNLFEEWTASEGDPLNDAKYRFLRLNVRKESPPTLRTAVEYCLELPGTSPVQVDTPARSIPPVLHTPESPSPSRLENRSASFSSSQCAGCNTKIKSAWSLFYKRVTLSCGHCFHSDDCFFDYIVRSDPRIKSPMCPMCDGEIEQEVIDTCFGRDKYEAKIKGYLRCTECGKYENLTKLPGCIHYVCETHKPRMMKNGKLRCSCRYNPWM